MVGIRNSFVYKQHVADPALVLTDQLKVPPAVQNLARVKEMPNAKRAKQLFLPELRFQVPQFHCTECHWK